MGDPRFLSCRLLFLFVLHLVTVLLLEARTVHAQLLDHVVDLVRKGMVLHHRRVVHQPVRDLPQVLVQGWIFVVAGFL